VDNVSKLLRKGNLQLHRDKLRIVVNLNISCRQEDYTISNSMGPFAIDEDVGTRYWIQEQQEVREWRKKYIQWNWKFDKLEIFVRKERSGRDCRLFRKCDKDGYVHRRMGISKKCMTNLEDELKGRKPREWALFVKQLAKEVKTELEKGTFDKALESASYLKVLKNEDKLFKRVEKEVKEAEEALEEVQDMFKALKKELYPYKLVWPYQGILSSAEYAVEKIELLRDNIESCKEDMYGEE